MIRISEHYRQGKRKEVAEKYLDAVICVLASTTTKQAQELLQSIVTDLQQVEVETEKLRGPYDRNNSSGVGN